MTSPHPGERVADRTNLGPDHRTPDDVPLDGLDENLAAEAVDLDHVLALLDDRTTTLTPRSEYL